MLYLNARLRERYGFLSRQAIQSFLKDPHLYAVENLGEIKINKLRRTRNKLFWPGKVLLDKSVIFIRSCLLEKMNEAKAEHLPEGSENELTSIIASVPNAFVSDWGGKIPVVCPFKIEEETRLGNVLIFYYHRLGIFRLEHSEQTPTKNKATLDVFERLNEILNIKEV